MLAAVAAQGVQDAVLSGSFVAAFPVAGAAGRVSYFSPMFPPWGPGYLSYVAGRLRGGGRSSPSCSVCCSLVSSGASRDGGRRHASLVM